jgi:VIT1/CCC1 family predicted Fe2+/Mn2+ transporter
MGVVGTYSLAAGASRTDLRAALRTVLGSPAALTAEEQADRLADAIFDWLSAASVVVQVQAADIALQTCASPGSPTLGPAATMELSGASLLRE